MTDYHRIKTPCDQMTVNIYGKINEVRKLCAYIQKDKTVEGAGYMAVSHDAVTAELRPYLIEQGIVIVPRLIKSVVIQDTGMSTKNNIPIIRYEAMYEIDFVNVDEPTDRVTVPIESHALDQGDKAPGKAASYATKYAMLKLFSIETGEADEGRPQDVKADGHKHVTSKVSGTDGAVENITPERREVMARVMSSIVDCFDSGAEQEAFKAFKEVSDTEERLALWHMLKPHSTMRRRIKDMGEAERKAAGLVKERDPALHRRD